MSTKVERFMKQGDKFTMRVISLAVLLLCTTTMQAGVVGQPAESGQLGPFTLFLNECESYTLYHSPSAPSDVTLIIRVVSLETQAIENIKVDVDGPGKGPDVDLHGDKFLLQGYPAIVRVIASTIAIATESSCDLADRAHIDIIVIEHAR
jgi:hypothetical protein